MRIGEIGLAGKPGSVVDSHSSRPDIAARLKPPTRRLSEPLHRLPIWCCSGWRLPRFTPDLTGSSLWPCSSPHGVWPLASILLYGARTFLSVQKHAATVWPTHADYRVVFIRIFAKPLYWSSKRNSAQYPGVSLKRSPPRRSLPAAAFVRRRNTSGARQAAIRLPLFCQAASFQPTVSPARKGISFCPPMSRVSGTVQFCFFRVIFCVLRGMP